MAAILTRETRHPQFRHFYIVDNFVSLATEFAKHPNVMFFPIDLYDNPENRKMLLKKVVRHLGISASSNEDIIDKVAAEWIPQNVTPNNRFKAVYKFNDVQKAQKMLGCKWAEVEYLKNMASIIMPFLADLGYQREQLRLW